MELPEPPATSFASDNTTGIDPVVLDALVAANAAPAAGAYGTDDLSHTLTEAMRDLIGSPVEVLSCFGGTGANTVALASLLAPWQAVVCAETAHVVEDEAGGPTRFSGSMLLTVPGVDGKLTPDSLARYRSWQGIEHRAQPAVVSVSQTTELGTVYTPDELAALCDAAHAAGMRVHMDGARIANAVAATGCELDVLVRDTGVDVLTFGATKNGAAYGEAVVFVDPDLAGPARFVRKQAGQLPSKTRFVAAQLLALLDGGRWIANASHANAMARRLATKMASVEGVVIERAPEANAVFAHLARAAIRPAQRWSPFWVWDDGADVVRWMTSFATPPADVDRFVDGIAAVLAAHTGT